MQRNIFRLARRMKVFSAKGLALAGK